MKLGQIIIPAIIPQTADEIVGTLETFQSITEVQIDVVDGAFVPHVSWPYEPLGEPAEISSVLDGYQCEIDLMTEQPIAAATAWATAGAAAVVFHIETVDLAEIQEWSSQYPNCQVGVSALNDTPLDMLIEYIQGVADYVQVMGIAEIGAQGATFDERALDRIRNIRQAFPELLISVDGSVNPNTIGRLCEAGANRLVVGSALLAASNREERLQELTDLARSSTGH